MRRRGAAREIGPGSAPPARLDHRGTTDIEAAPARRHASLEAAPGTRNLRRRVVMGRLRDPSCKLQVPSPKPSPDRESLQSHQGTSEQTLGSAETPVCPRGSTLRRYQNDAEGRSPPLIDQSIALNCLQSLDRSMGQDGESSCVLPRLELLEVSHLVRIRGTGAGASPDLRDTHHFARDNPYKFENLQLAACSLPSVQLVCSCRLRNDSRNSQLAGWVTVRVFVAAPRSSARLRAPARA
jgi:hypothetical protein